MKRVHIKIADTGWILEKCAREIAGAAAGISYGLHSDPTAALQYYINYSSYESRVAPIEVAFFTHSEPSDAPRQRFFTVAHSVDYRVCMSQRYASEMRESGLGDVSVISPGVDLSLFRPKVRVGVVGRTYHTGRKGEALVAQMMDIRGIEWRFTGSGWPIPSSLVTDDAMPDFYNDLDYVLIPSSYEGGPMSMLEALACGIPVIASDVGWVNEFPHIGFQNGNANSLREVLVALVREREALRTSVEDRTWDAWRDAHVELFDRLLGGHVMPTRPARRVVKPRHRSVAMISKWARGLAKGGQQRE